MQFQVCLTFTVLSLFLAATGASGSESETATIATGLDYDDDLPRSDRRAFGDEHLEVIEDLKRKPCRSNVKVKNGRRRIENGGLEMKFRCNPGFMILGATVSICQNGKWSEEPPVCVKSGCKRFIMPQGVLGRPLFNGAVFSFHCQNPQQIMRGSPMIVCNGEKWNATTPRCYDPPTTTTTTEPTSTTSTTSAATTKTSTVIEHTSEKIVQDSLPEATDEAKTTQTEVSTTTDSMDLFQNPNWPSMNFTLQPIVEPEPNEVPEWPFHNTTTTTTTTTSTSKPPTSVPTSAATWTTTASHHAVIWLNQTRKPEATTTSTTSPHAILTTTTQKVSETNMTTPSTSTIKSLNSETTSATSTASTTSPQTVNSTTRAPETSTTSAAPLTTTSTTTTPSPPLTYTSKSEPLTPKPIDKQPESVIIKWTTTPRSFVTYCSKFKGKKLEECLRQVNVTGRPGTPRRRPARPTTRKYPSRGGGPTRRPLSTRKPAWKPDYGSVANQSAPSIPLGLDSDEEPEDIKPLTTSTSTTTMTSASTSSTSTTTTSKIELISAVDWHKLEQDNIPVKGTQLTEDSENGRIRRPKARDATDLGTAVMILVAIVVMVIAAGFAGRKYWRKHWGIARRSRSDSDCGSFNLGFSRECEDEFVFKEFGSGTATTTRDM